MDLPTTLSTKSPNNKVMDESETEQGRVQMGYQSCQNMVVDSKIQDRKSAPILIQKCTLTIFDIRVHHEYLKQCLNPQFGWETIVKFPHRQWLNSTSN